MRNFFIISIIVTIISLFYKWRYRLLNALLAVTVLRRLIVQISMKIPKIRTNVTTKSFEKLSSYQET